jgi:hypothetical protein
VDADLIIDEGETDLVEETESNVDEINLDFQIIEISRYQTFELKFFLPIWPDNFKEPNVQVSVYNRFG